MLFMTIMLGPVQVVISNLVVKYVAATTVATLTCQSISAASAAEDWKQLYQVGW